MKFLSFYSKIENEKIVRCHAYENKLNIEGYEVVEKQYWIVLANGMEYEVTEEFYAQCLEKLERER